MIAALLCTCFGGVLSVIWLANVSLQLLPEAEATQERRL